MNNWMSSCREPATITFGPSQDHPILPLGISLKKLIILLKGESATHPSFWSNIIKIELGMGH